MIQVPIFDLNGKEVDRLDVDEAVLGGSVRPVLLKQAYVRFHANRRQGSAATKNRGQVEGSTRKLYKQKGTGNARRGPSGTNIMRGGGHAFAKKAKSWRQRMPAKMRRLANRNALLAKVVDGELKLVKDLAFDRPSTKQLSGVMKALKIDRSCLVALRDPSDSAGKSAKNLADVTLTQVDRLNAFDLLNHRYVLSDVETLKGWIESGAEQIGSRRGSSGGDTAGS